MLRNSTTARVPLEVKDELSKEKIKENRSNLKTQAFYRSGRAVKEGEYSISEAVANKMYDKSMTVRQRFIHERKAIKKPKETAERKLELIKKEEMKLLLGGESPDMMDAFAMREYFELKPKQSYGLQYY